MSSMVLSHKKHSVNTEGESACRETLPMSQLACPMVSKLQEGQPRKRIVVVQRMDSLPPSTCIDPMGIWLSQSFAPGVGRGKEREKQDHPHRGPLPQQLLLLVWEGVQSLSVLCRVGPRDSCPCDSPAVCVSSVTQHQVLFFFFFWKFFSAVASAFPPWHPWVNHVLAGPDM